MHLRRDLPDILCAVAASLRCGETSAHMRGGRGMNDVEEGQEALG